MNAPTIAARPLSFFEEIDVLRRDDHRLYHQSRINQTLHLISACMFLVAYVLVWFKPAEAAILGWFGGMCTRQTGHFVFEPRGFDKIHNVSNDTKEAIKVGFNVWRKIAILVVWVLIPVALMIDSSALGVWPRATSAAEIVHRVGIAWLALGTAGLFARTLWLIASGRVRTGAAWFVKILTDPFHNVREYWQSPLFLLRGQLYEPLESVDFYAHHERARSSAIGSS